MNYTIETIADFCGGERSIAIPGTMVRGIMIDSREPVRLGGLFVAIKGAKVDAHDFIPGLIEKGVRNFLVSDDQWNEQYKDTANFILVKDVISALQSIAIEHRDNFRTRVVGITGSNGKTIVKEWLNILLEGKHQVCRSPKSFNSQIGVALSVCKLELKHTLAVFEAGISQPNEMRALEQMVKPDIGVFTNLGDAHAAHFESDKQKLLEKIQLFDHAEQVVCSVDHRWFDWLPAGLSEKLFSWSAKGNRAVVQFKVETLGENLSRITALKDDEEFVVRISFTDRASVENAINCLCTLILLGVTDEETLERFEALSPVAMRMEVKQGIEGSILIDDSYNSDLESLRAALEHLRAQGNREKMVILTDLGDKSGSKDLYARVGVLLKEAEVANLVTIGPETERFASCFVDLSVSHFSDANEYWKQLDTGSLKNKSILIKGARKFKLEQLVKRLQAQQHETTLEIDLQKLGHNLNFFRSKLSAGVKTMVMVKAFGYGSGGFEIASYLQSQKTDYLAVAYADEGVELRKKGIYLPILVMSPTKSTFDAIIRNNLEPEIYSVRSLKEFIESAVSMRHLFEEINIHLKIDSGMHRLGFERADIAEISWLLRNNRFIKVASVFTHLSSAEDHLEDHFSRQQVEQFLEMVAEIESAIGYKPDRHVLNSSGALRFPEYQFEMVRLGIGLYGFVGTDQNKYLSALGTLKSYIVQIRDVAQNESVGYSRKGKHHVSRRIATVAIGYADGLDRRLSGGRWSLKWEKQDCPIVGNVCMDMCMIDVTNTNAMEGDEIVVFDGARDIERMAAMLETIPYEILTKVSQRVRRVYLQE
ncbi:MAG: bifunctional UDP-N-acetylmuramoyl-tripeptide:D-alanyl-D-alanine ligase/alanine racemase [Flavobacteriales bacterium]